MKLIQHLERKLSWRRKQQGVQNANTAKDSKSTRKTAKKFASAAIKVSDSEFSQYIRFANPLRTVPMPSVPSYEIVNIRTRSPLQCTKPAASVVSQVPPNRSPSPRREDGHDGPEHIYDFIGIAHPPPTPPRHSTPLPSPATSPTVTKYFSPDTSFGPITVTSATRRNRIKTNPWFSSPWAGKKNLPSADNYGNVPAKSHCNKIENDYESIENLLDWQESKENLSLPGMHSLNGHAGNQYFQHHLHPTEWTPSPVAQLHVPISQRVGTYLKGRLPHYQDSYPQSPFSQASPETERHFLAQVVPSPEFLNQSHQICSEISSYFDVSHSPKEKPRGCPPQRAANSSAASSTARPSFVNESLLSKFDSMETIDLTPDLNDDYYRGQALSEWSLNAPDDSLSSSQQPRHHQQHSSISSTDDTSSPEQSPKSRKALANGTYSKPPKRKRPESIYSTRQSKKVDKLKSQLKEVVHAAILEAKKDDSKKA